MKKFFVTLFVLVCIAIPATSFSSTKHFVLITEVELNPPCDDSAADCQEWVELINYDVVPVTLDDWEISSFNGKKIITIPLGENGCQGVLIPRALCVISHSNWLNNDGEKLVILDRDFDEMASAEVKGDTGNDNKTWQYCFTFQKFVFRDQTKFLRNGC